MNVKMAPLVLCVLISYCVGQSAGGSVNYDTMSERDNSTEGMRKDKALDRIRRMGVPTGKHSQLEDMTGTTKSALQKRDDSDNVDAAIQNQRVTMEDVWAGDTTTEETKYPFEPLKKTYKQNTVKKQTQIGNFDVKLVLIDLRDHFKTPK